MSEGMTELQKNIQTLEDLLSELREEKRELHAVLKDVRKERAEIERMMHDDVKKRVNNQVDKVVRVELEKIAPTIRKHTSVIYERVGNQIDKLINISLGREFSTKKRSKDLRPILGEKLRELIIEIIELEEASEELPE